MGSEKKESKMTLRGEAEQLAGGIDLGDKVGFRQIVRGRGFEPSEPHSESLCFFITARINSRKGAVWVLPTAFGMEVPQELAQGSRLSLTVPPPLPHPPGTGVLPGKMAWVPRLREHLGCDRI